MNILFVCTGNTCRSPMAEALLRHKYPDVNVQSAGVYAANYQSANQNALTVLKEKQIDLQHRSQSVTSELLQWADIVLTMTTEHKRASILHFPHEQEKYFTLKEYVSTEDHAVWTELKQVYAKIEEKRAQFIQQNQNKQDMEALEKGLAEHLLTDIERLRYLESSLINYDISDPFGGDASIYRDTVQELEGHIDSLIVRLKQQE